LKDKCNKEIHTVWFQTRIFSYSFKTSSQRKGCRRTFVSIMFHENYDYI